MNEDWISRINSPLSPGAADPLRYMQQAAFKTELNPPGPEEMIAMRLRLPMGASMPF